MCIVILAVEGTIKMSIIYSYFPRSQESWTNCSINLPSVEDISWQSHDLHSVYYTIWLPVTVATGLSLAVSLKYTRCEDAGVTCFCCCSRVILCRRRPGDGPVFRPRYHTKCPYLRL